MSGLLFGGAETDAELLPPISAVDADRCRRVQARRQGGVRWVRAYTPKYVKCKIKNTDTVHNARCVEKRSTFLQNTPFSTFLQNIPIFHFLTNTPIFHFVTKQPHFPLFLQNPHFPLFLQKTPPPFHFLPTGLEFTYLSKLHIYMYCWCQKALKRTQNFTMTGVTVQPKIRTATNNVYVMNTQQCRCV